MKSTKQNSGAYDGNEILVSRGRPPPAVHRPHSVRQLATPVRCATGTDPDFPMHRGLLMPLSSDAEARIMTITGLFMLVFLGTACFYPWQSCLACLLMLMFVSYLLQTFGGNRRR